MPFFGHSPLFGVPDQANSDDCMYVCRVSFLQDHLAERAAHLYFEGCGPKVFTNNVRRFLDLRELYASMNILSILYAYRRYVRGGREC